MGEDEDQKSTAKWLLNLLFGGGAITSALLAILLPRWLDARHPPKPPIVADQVDKEKIKRERQESAANLAACGVTWRPTLCAKGESGQAVSNDRVNNTLMVKKGEIITVDWYDWDDHPDLTMELTPEATRGQVRTKKVNRSGREVLKADRDFMISLSYSSAPRYGAPPDLLSNENFSIASIHVSVQQALSP